jgi:hypothetical protein
MKPLEILAVLLVPLLVAHTILLVVGYSVDVPSVVVGQVASWATFIWLGALEVRAKREKSKS